MQIDLLANDSDPDGPSSALRVLSSTTPSLGIAERVGGALTFSAGNVTGDTTITYQVGDDDGGVTTGHVVIVISEPELQPPIAVDDARTIPGPGVPTPFDVLGNDIDPDGSNADLTLGSVTVDTGNGTVEVNGRSVILTPAPGLVGEVVATYTVADPDGGTDTGSVTLTVLEIPNRPPLAGDDQAEVVTGGTVTVPIALNDSDPDGDPLDVLDHDSTRPRARQC